MATSNDIEVTILLQVGFLENLVGYPDSQKHRSSWAKETERIWGSEANLPPNG